MGEIDFFIDYHYYYYYYFIIRLMKNYCHLWGAGVYVKAEAAYSRIRTWACPAGGDSPWHWVGRDAVVLQLLYIEQLIYLFYRNFMSCV